MPPQDQALIQRVLGDPSQFPDAFKQWIPRWVQYNVNFQLQKSQLPSVESAHAVGGTGNAAFAGTWANFGGSNAVASYYKDPFNRVFLDGCVASGVIGTTIFTLPAGYRPQYILIFPVVSNGLFGVCTVNPDGTVVATSGSNTYFSLSGISFRQFS